MHAALELYTSRIQIALKLIQDWELRSWRLTILLSLCSLTNPVPESSVCVAGKLVRWSWGKEVPEHCWGSSSAPPSCLMKKPNWNSHGCLSQLVRKHKTFSSTDINLGIFCSSIRCRPSTAATRIFTHQPCADSIWTILSTILLTTRSGSSPESLTTTGLTITESAVKS